MAETPFLLHDLLQEVHVSSDSQCLFMEVSTYLGDKNSYTDVKAKVKFAQNNNPKSKTYYYDK